MKTLPEPPRSLRIQGWLRSLGILFLGLSALIGAFIIVILLNTVSDSVDLAKENERETDCRAQLANQASRLQGEINSVGWIALLKYVTVTGDEEEAIQEEIVQLNSLVIEWREAQDRRNRSDQICKE